MSQLGMGIFEGREAIRRFFKDWIEAYEDYEIEVEAIQDVGSGVTLTELVQGGRPVGSSGFVRLCYASVATWSDGLVDWMGIYTDIDQARADAERLAEERG
jgi:hypothetical protein